MIKAESGDMILLITLIYFARSPNRYVDRELPVCVYVSGYKLVYKTEKPPGNRVVGAVTAISPINQRASWLPDDLTAHLRACVPSTVVPCIPISAISAKISFDV